MLDSKGYYNLIEGLKIKLLSLKNKKKELEVINSELRKELEERDREISKLKLRLNKPDTQKIIDEEIQEKIKLLVQEVDECIKVLEK